MPDQTIAHPQTDARLSGPQHAVGHSNILTDPFRMEKAVLSGGTDGNTVVRRIDHAITYNDLTATVDIQTIPVPDAFLIPDAHTADRNVRTAMEETGPVGRIDHFHILQQDVTALAEIQHLGRTPPGEVIPAVKRRIKKRRPVAIDFSTPDRHMVHFQRNDQVGTEGFFRQADTVLGAEIRLIVVFRIGTAQDHGAVFQFQRGLGAEVEGTAEIGPRREVNRAALINGTLNRCRILCDTIAHRTEIQNILHKSLSFRHLLELGIDFAPEIRIGQIGQCHVGDG